jgi:hypothetical protein
MLILLRHAKPKPHPDTNQNARLSNPEKPEAKHHRLFMATRSVSLNFLSCVQLFYVIFEIFERPHAPDLHGRRQFAFFDGKIAT